MSPSVIGAAIGVVPCPADVPPAAPRLQPRCVTRWRRGR